MMIFLNAALEERGIWAQYLITSGNEAGLSVPDYVAFFADQPELKVIIIYVEAIANPERFAAACRLARSAGKEIVAVKLGQSEAGRNAALAPALAPQTTQRLNAVLGVGSLVGNPIDGGFGVLTSAENYLASIEAMQADPNLDMLLLQEALPREPGSARAENYIAMVEAYAATARKPIAFVTPVSHGQTEHSRALRERAPHVSFLQEANKALRAIAAVARARAQEQLAGTAPSTERRPTPEQSDAIAHARARASNISTALDEFESKQLLRAYGIMGPAEALVTSAAEALRAADRIGYPVVLKAVAAELTHKSDVGAVALDLLDAGELAAEYEAMSQRLRQHAVTGMLVCRQIRGGLELVLGLHRDPEMGLVAMAGSGGILLELVRDVAFCMPPVSPEKARDMIARTRAGALLDGYRGGGALDSEAVVAALVSLGDLAVDLGDVLESVDINPFVALLPGQGGLALDALVVMRRR
jgi:acyl-CoA synthetase (NDP forming)